MAISQYKDDPFIKTFGLQAGSEIFLVYTDADSRQLVTDKSIRFNRGDDGVEITNDGTCIIRYKEPLPRYNGKEVVGIAFGMHLCYKIYNYSYPAPAPPRTP